MTSVGYSMGFHDLVGLLCKLGRIKSVTGGPKCFVPFLAIPWGLIGNHCDPTVPGVDECFCAGVKYLEDLDVGDVIYLEPNKSSNKVSVANSRGGGGDVSGRTPPPPPLETWLYFCSSF